MRPRCIPLFFVALILIVTSALAQNNFTTTSYAAPAAQHIRAVDLNNDGYPDLVLFGDNFTNPYGGSNPGTPLAIMLNNGKGGFSAATVIDASGYVTMSAAVADLNGDGLPDIAACEAPNTVNNQNTLNIYLNQGGGKFTLAHSIDAPLGCSTIAIGDANKDGKADIALATEDSGEKNEESNNVTTYFGDGTGNFPTSVTQGFNLDGSRPNELCGVRDEAGADFNGDGILDLVVVVDCQLLNNESNVFLLTGDGTGNYTATELFESTDDYTADEPYVADVNGDGQPDVILVGQQSPATNEHIGDLNFLINQGSGKFDNVNVLHLDSDTSSYADHVYAGAAGSFNGDQYQDAVVAYNESGQPGLAVLYGTNNSGGYGSPVVLTAPTGLPLSAAAADFSKSGMDGFAVLEQSGTGVNSIVVYASSSSSTCAPPSVPGVNVCSPTPNEDVSSPVNFIAAGTGASGTVNHLELWIDNAKVGNYSGAEMNASVPVAAGTHQATVVEVDSAGNYVKSTPVNFTVGASSCTPPSEPGVNVCSPAPNADVSSPVNFIAAGTGASGTVNHLELWIDNAKIGNYSGAEMNTSVTVASGTHQATVVEVDSKGNYVKSTPVNFTVGTSSCTPPSAPGVNVCSPTPNAGVSSPVNFIAAGTGASGSVNHLELWVDNAKIGNYTGAEMNTSVTLDAGAHQATVIEVDSKGNYVKSTPVNFTVN